MFFIIIRGKLENLEWSVLLFIFFLFWLRLKRNAVPDGENYDSKMVVCLVIHMI